MKDYKRIEAIIRYIDDHQSDQPDLETLAQHSGLSQFHFHRLFSDWAGITPKAFLKCLTINHAKTCLHAGASVLRTSLDSGLSGPSRLHDLCVSVEAASPGEIKSGGAGWTITAGVADSPFGTCVIGENDRGICHLSFVPSEIEDVGSEVVLDDWPNAAIRWDCAYAECVANSVFACPEQVKERSALKAVVRGTDFQVRVWRALLEIPAGELTSYSRLAESVDRRSATRAVASAVGQNRLAFLIPCHRVIRETGAIGEYRWGPARKQAMVAWEGATRSAS